MASQQLVLRGCIQVGTELRKGCNLRQALLQTLFLAA